MKCQHCNKVMDSTRADAKFCSGACRVAAHRARTAPPKASLKPDGDLIKARAEIERLQAEVEKLQKQAHMAQEKPAKPSASTSSSSDELAKAQAEIARLIDQIAAMTGMPQNTEQLKARGRAFDEARKRKRAAEREAAAGKYADVDEPTLLEKLAQAEKQLAAAKTANKNLRIEVRAMQDFCDRKHPGAMSLATYGQIAKCLHTDKEPPSVKDREEAMKLLNAWRSDSKATRGR